MPTLEKWGFRILPLFGMLLVLFPLVSADEQTYNYLQALLRFTNGIVELILALFLAGFVAAGLTALIVSFVNTRSRLYEGAMITALISLLIFVSLFFFQISNYSRIEGIGFRIHMQWLWLFIFAAIELLALFLHAHYLASITPSSEYGGMEYSPRHNDAAVRQSLAQKINTSQNETMATLGKEPQDHQSLLYNMEGTTSPIKRGEKINKPDLRNHKFSDETLSGLVLDETTRNPGDLTMGEFTIGEFTQTSLQNHNTGLIQQAEPVSTIQRDSLQNNPFSFADEGDSDLESTTQPLKKASEKSTQAFERTFQNTQAPDEVQGYLRIESGKFKDHKIRLKPGRPLYLSKTNALSFYEQQKPESILSIVYMPDKQAFLLENLGGNIVINGAPVKGNALAKPGQIIEIEDEKIRLI